MQPGLSLLNVFSLSSQYQRAHLTSGGVAHEVVHGARVTNDPVLSCSGDLVANWWHANNGARIAIDCAHLSDPTVNDDDTHGLGNELGATTHAQNTASNDESMYWWHDVSVIQGDCHGAS